MKKGLITSLIALLLVFGFFSCENGLGQRSDTSIVSPRVAEMDFAPVYDAVTPGYAASPSAGSSTNLLTNSGFESGTSPWFPFSSSSGGGIARTTEEARSGSYSLYGVGGAHNFSRPLYDVTDLVADGGYYYIEAWVKAADGSPNNMTTTVTLGVGQRLITPQPPIGGVTRSVPTVEVSDSEWRKISGYVRLGSSSSMAYSVLALSTTSTLFYPPNIHVHANDQSPRVYFDDVVLRPVVAINRPYPQQEDFAGCIKPQGISQETLDSDITTLYDRWKDEYLIEMNFTNGVQHGSFSSYVVKGEANGTLEEWGGVTGAVSQSEAHGYGMILMALMAGHDSEARDIFDDMFKLYVNLPCKDNSSLMTWAIPENGNLSLAKLPSATDGDMDTAYALLLANDQWGGTPSWSDTTYYDHAIEIIEGLEANNILTGSGPHFPRLGCGDHESDKNYDKYKATRSSDFMLSHMDLFYQVTGDWIWLEVKESTIAITEYIQANHSPETGLMPDFMGNKNDFGGNIQVFDGISDEPSDKPGEDVYPDDIEGTGLWDDTYYFNGCRFPWRTALSYAHSNIPEAGVALNNINDWLVDNVSGPSAVRGGYFIETGAANGFPEVPQWVKWGAPWYSSCFAGPFMAGLMASDEDSEMADYWNHIKAFELPDGTTGYYENTLKMLSMLLVSGNWWEPSGTENGGGVTPSPQNQEWIPNMVYAVGSIVDYNGETWINTYAHTSNMAWYPGAPGLWFWERYDD